MLCGLARARCVESAGSVTDRVARVGDASMAPRVWGGDSGAGYREAPAVRRPNFVGSAIRVPPVRDLHCGDDEGVVRDLVKDAGAALADPVSFLPGEFFVSWWPGFVGQRVDPFQYPDPVGFRDAAQVSCDRLPELQLTTCHSTSTRPGVVRSSTSVPRRVPRRRPGPPDRPPAPCVPRR